MLNEGLNVDGMKLDPHPVNPGYLGMQSRNITKMSSSGWLSNC